MKILLATFGVISLMFAGCSTSNNDVDNVNETEEVGTTAVDVEDVVVEGDAAEEAAETVDQESAELGE